MQHKLLGLSLEQLSDISDEQIAEVLKNQLTAAKDDAPKIALLTTAFNELNSVEKRQAYIKNHTQASASSSSTAKLTIEVGNNKIRLLIDSDETTTLQIRNYLSEKFKFRINYIPTNVQRFYNVNAWGRAWNTSETLARIEWWYPKQFCVEANILPVLSAMLRPLGLKANKQHFQTLLPRQYANPLKNFNVAPEKALAVCKSFIEYSDDFIKTKFPTEIEGYFDQGILFSAAASTPYEKKYFGPGMFDVALARSESISGQLNSLAINESADDDAAPSSPAPVLMRQKSVFNK